MIGTRIKHFEVIEKIGAGGMGEIYLAKDTKLDRNVALKFLPREFATDPGRRKRLELEAKSASSLDHPNILTIYEIDEHDGQPFIAMSYIEGASLKEKMESGRLPLEDAVRYGIQIAAGLGAAHARGIIHRDVKPDNVLIGQDDRARLTDFGLARLKESSGLTGRGTTVGTVGYMSPEQAQGMEVDARSDVFSIGVMLYELFTGQRPFVAEHAAAALYSIVHEQPTPVREINPDVPEALAMIVDRALAKAPSDRYTDARALEADLRSVARELEFSRISSGTIAVPKQGGGRRLAWAAAGLLIIWLGVVLAFFPNIFRSEESEVQAIENSLAVMYFENLSDPDDEERLGDIITELLTTDLSGSDYLTVISTQRLHDLLQQAGLRESKRIDRDVASKIADKAGAARMLIGTLSNLGGRTIITAQLVDVQSGEVVGSERVDGTDIFAVVDELSTRIKEEIGLSGPELASGDRPIAEATTTSAEAYREYLKGIDYYHSLEWEEAHRHFDRALAIDSTFPLAYIRKGIAYMSDGNQEQGFAMMLKAGEYIDRVTGCDRLLVEAFAKDLSQDMNPEGALRTLKRATTQYPTHKEPFFWVANMTYGYGHSKDSALYYLDKALELDPNYPFALLTKSELLMEREAHDEARETIERYIAVRPNDVVPYTQLAELALNEGHPDSALMFGYQALDVAPDNRIAYGTIGQVHVLMGQPDSAITWYQEMMAVDESPNTQFIGYMRIGNVHFSWGHFARALEFFSRAENVASTAGLNALHSSAQQNIGWMYYHTGRYEDALQHFTRAHEIDTINQSQHNRAIAFARLGNLDSALAIIDDVARRWRGRIDSAQFEEARHQVSAFYHLDEGDYEKAIDEFERGREVAGDSAAWRVSMGEALTEAGRYEEAIAELSDYIESTEKSGWPGGNYLNALYRLAKAKVQNGQPREAIPYLERFLALWGDADWEVPLIDDAKNLYASLSTQ